MRMANPEQTSAPIRRRWNVSPPLVFALVIGVWCLWLWTGGPPAVDRAAAQVAAPASRPAQRPELTPGQYAALARRLRAAYAKPPAQWPRPTLDPGVERVELAPPPRPVFPADNPYTPAKAELGKMLFFDPRLSGSGQISCASCHEPQLGWSDGRAVSFGHGRTALRRNAPTLNNIAFRKSLFWDGRAKDLESQIAGPVLAADEMHGDADQIVQRLAAQAEYRRRFAQGFGDDKPITFQRIAQAVATYERTIVSRPSAFDHFLKGDRDALSDAAVRGLHLFRTDARCLNCHSGPTFSDEKFHDLGLSYYGRKYEDLGRYGITHDPKDVGLFKTPSLRNITRTGPYMHNGLFDLKGVLRMYNAGMATLRRKPSQINDPLFPTKSPLLKPLGLNAQDLNDLEAFLQSLEETRLRITPPPLPGPAPATTRPAER
jgi:cytochrome c peroxidase